MGHDALDEISSLIDVQKSIAVVIIFFPQIVDNHHKGLIITLVGSIVVRILGGSWCALFLLLIGFRLQGLLLIGLIWHALRLRRLGVIQMLINLSALVFSGALS